MKITNLLVAGFVCICGMLSVTDVVQADKGDANSCTEIQYGTGRQVSGGCREMDVTVISQCTRGAKVYVNYSYDGKDVYGDNCSGSENDAFALYANPGTTTTGKVLACKCWQTYRAWIVDAYASF